MSRISQQSLSYFTAQGIEGTIRNLETILEGYIDDENLMVGDGGYYRGPIPTESVTDVDGYTESEVFMSIPTNKFLNAMVGLEQTLNQRILPSEMSLDTSWSVTRDSVISSNNTTLPDQEDGVQASDGTEETFKKAGAASSFRQKVVLQRNTDRDFVTNADFLGIVYDLLPGEFTFSLSKAAFITSRCQYYYIEPESFVYNETMEFSANTAHSGDGALVNWDFGVRVVAEDPSISGDFVTENRVLQIFKEGSVETVEKPFYVNVDYSKVYLTKIII